MNIRMDMVHMGANTIFWYFLHGCDLRPGYLQHKPQLGFQTDTTWGANSSEWLTAFYLDGTFHPTAMGLTGAWKWGTSWPILQTASQAAQQVSWTLWGVPVQMSHCTSKPLEAVTRVSMPCLAWHTSNCLAVLLLSGDVVVVKRM
jgi:hypothetical protein